MQTWTGCPNISSHYFSVKQKDVNFFSVYFFIYGLLDFWRSTDIDLFFSFTLE